MCVGGANSCLSWHIWWVAYAILPHIRQMLRFHVFWGLTCSHWQESRSRENLEKKWVNFFSLELEKWFFISLFPLDFQELKKKFLVLFSIYEILLSYSRSLLDFQDFEEKFLFLLSIYEILLSYSRSLLDFQDFEEKFLLSLSIVKILLYLFLFLFLWEMVYFREKYALLRFLWTLCDSPETLTGWKSESGTDQPTDSPEKLLAMLTHLKRQTPKIEFNIMMSRQLCTLAMFFSHKNQNTLWRDMRPMNKGSPPEKKSI